MSTDIERAVALATKISAKAEDILSRLDREVTVMKWPPQFRVIMWEAVAHAASIRAAAAQGEQK